MDLIDRIKYNAKDDTVFAWKFPGEQIRLGAQLIVNQSQEVIFVKGGKALDAFGPGTHTLSSGNLPLLGKLVNLPFGGKTPFTAEVWYVNKIAKRDLKWGTKAPIQLMDSVHNYPVSVRAFGRWGFRIDDARSFLVQTVGTLAQSEAKKVEDYFTGEILQRLSDALAKYLVDKNISFLHLNSKLNELSSFVKTDISLEFNRFGIEIVNFNVVSISIPDEEQKKFQKIYGDVLEINQISKAQIGQAYVTKRTFDTLDKAASTQNGSMGGILSAGLGVGAGLSAGLPIGQQIGKSMNLNSENNGKSDMGPAERLEQLKKMCDKGLISAEEYENKKKTILDSI